MSTAILIFLVFTTATLAACYAAWWLPEQQAREAAERRLRGLRAERTQRRAGPLLRERSLSSIGFLDDIYGKMRIVRQLQMLLDQGQLPYQAGAVLSMCFGLATLTFLAGQSLGLFPILAVAILAAAGAGSLPIFYVWRMRDRRMSRIEELLPEAIDLFTRAMRAGHNIHSGIEVLAKEMAEPIAGEFKKVVDDLNLGATVDSALHSLGERVPLLDMRFLTTGLVLQRETGANLVQVLENLSAVIRERLQLRAKLRAHTAQQRFSAALLCGLPIGTGLVFYFVRYDYISILWTTDSGAKFLTYAIVSELVGIFVIKRISAIRM